MKKQMLFWAIGMLAITPFSGHGQTADQKMLPSGTGGLNGSLGNLMSPSLFDGSTNVNIPIYDYGAFGISLSYNTKGVTVDELSGQLGTHWNLNAGGTITRNVKDLPDDINKIYYKAANPTSPLKAIGRQRQYALTTQQNDEYWDGSNDEFSVSAGNLQFSFMLGKNGYVLAYPQNNCKITFTSSNFQVFERFLITDEQGIRYYFGTSDDVMNGSFSFGDDGRGDYAYTPKWYLDSVVLSNGQKISYDYEGVTIPTQPLTQVELYKTATRTEHITLGTSTPVDFGIVRLGDLQNWTYVLKTIHYPNDINATFVFDQPPTPNGEECMKSIKQIEISQNGNCQKLRFNKTYFGRTSTVPFVESSFTSDCNYNPYDKRLMLHSIDKLSCDETKVEPYYTFEYYHSSVPFRWGNNRDFFAYCNYIVTDVGSGYLNNYINQMPNYNAPFSTAYMPLPSSSKDNTTNVDIMSTLCLKKVSNAYGGSISFQYEVHSGLTNPTDIIAGMPNPDYNHLFLGKNANDGLRLHATVTEDKYLPTSKLVTTYDYSGGQRFLNGGYFSYPSKQDINGNIIEYTTTNSWASPHQLVNGSNHGYSQVTVTSSDGSGNMLSQEKHYFSNFLQGTSDLMYKPGVGASGLTKHYFELPYTDKQYIMTWRLGLPTKTETFDAFGNITSRTTNSYGYSEDFTSAEAGLGRNLSFMWTTRNGTKATIFHNYTIMATDNFVPFTGRTLLLSTTSEKFISNTVSMSDVVTYTYDVRNNLSTTTTRNSRGEYFQLKNVYNYDISSPAGSTLAIMTSSGLEMQVSMERWKLGSSTPNNLLHDASITGYRYQDGKIWTQKLHTLRSLQPVTYNSYTNSGTGLFNKILTAYNNPTQTIADLQVVSEVLQFDTKGNPLETQLAGQNSFISMVWDTYGNKMAEASCPLADMAYTGFESLNHGNWIYDEINVNGGFMPTRIDGRYYHGSSSTSPLRLTSLTVGRSYKIAFWARGGVPLITCGGSVQLEITNGVNGWAFWQGKFVAGSATLSLASPSGGSGFYLDDLMVCAADAQLTSSSYTPLWGVRSSSDASGRITYYEYDAFGRLVVTKNQEGMVVSKKEYRLGQ